MRDRRRGLLVCGAFLLCVAFLTGCSIRLRFYPVKGPIASATPNQVYMGRISASTTFNPKSGGFSAVLSDGEAFKGSWAMVGPNGKGGTASTPATNSLSDAWDTVFGEGFYVSHVLGQREYGRSVSTGSNGTVLQVEIYNPGTGPAETKAVAQDSKGNIYKVIPY